MMATNWQQVVRAAKAWRQDKSFHVRLLNIGHLLSGNFVSGLISLAAIALTARAVGPHNYGVLALAITYTRAVERLVTFQSWQPLIKYGAEVINPEHRADFKMLLKFGLALDAAGAVTAWFVATALTLTASSLFGWDSHVITMVIIYCTTLLFNINGTPTAVLRTLWALPGRCLWPGR